MNNKYALRQEIAIRKRSFSTAEKERLSASVIARLEKHPRFVVANTILLYYSLPDEVCTHSLVEKCGEQGKRILLPAVIGDELEIRLYSGQESLRIGTCNIQEPIGLPFINYSEIDLAIVPGVSFDSEGNRLGRGKGYYDRLLRLLSTYDVYKIGVCFDFQKCEIVPHESHDVPMDEVI